MNKNIRGTTIIIDNDLQTRAEIKRVCEACGIQVLAEAENGAQGMRLYYQHSPTFITLDTDMPMMDGLSMLRVLTKKNKNLPFIIISGALTKDVFFKAHQLGASYFCVKPFEDIVLITMIDELLEEVKENYTAG